jgi:hypothetical protein
VSYRREDSAGQTGRIGDRLALEFGQENLFLDVDSIPLGVDFVKHLSAEVARCDVLLAVIGPRWLDLRDENNERRVDKLDDFARIEIGAALKRDIPVIPVLIDGTKIPRADLLPEDIKGLSVRNGLDLRHSSFHVDMNRLVRELKATLSSTPSHDFTELLNELEGSLTTEQSERLQSDQEPIALISNGPEEVPWHETPWTKTLRVVRSFSAYWPSPGVACINVWAMASVAAFACGAAFLAGLVHIIPAGFSKILFSLTLLGGTVALLVVTAGWLRTRSQLIKAAVVGFSSMQMALLASWALIFYGVFYMSVPLFLMIAALHLFGTMLLYRYYLAET